MRGFEEGRRPWVVPVVFIVLGLLATYPLVTRFTTHVPGSGGDSMVFLWSYWWVGHALTDLGVNPYYTGHIFYPHETGLLMNTMTMLNALLSIPLQPVMGLAAINNLFIVLSFALSGWGGYLLAYHVTGSRRAALIAGLILAMSPSRSIRLLGHYNLYMTHWVPFYLLYLVRALDAEDRREGLRLGALAGVFLGLCLLTDYYYFILMGIATLIVYPLMSRGRWLEGARALAATALASLPLVALPVYMVLRERLSGDFRPTPAETGVVTYSADLMSYILPHSNGTLLGGGGLVSGDWLGKGLMDSTLYLGVAPMGLAAYAIYAGRKGEGRRAILPWVGLGLIFGLLSLGPDLKVMGRVLEVPMPFEALGALPLLDNLRAPGRFAIALMPALAVLAALGAARLASRWAWLPMAAAMVIALEYLAVPVPLYEARVSPAYERIKADASAEAVLELPFFVRDGFGYLGSGSYDEYLLNQTVHERPIMGGTVSRSTERNFFSYLNMPIVRGLIQIEDGRSLTFEQVSSERAMAQSWVDLMGIDYVSVHKARAGRGVEAFASYAIAMDKVFEDEALALYKTRRGEWQTMRVFAGRELSVPYLMRGWINGQRDGNIGFAWARGRRPDILLNLGEGSAYRIALRMKAHEGLGGEFPVEVSLDGVRLGEFRLTPAWGEYTVDVPVGLAHKGPEVLGLRYDRTVLEKGFLRFDPPGGVSEEYLREFGLYDYVREGDLDWEQDNSKYEAGAQVGLALNSLEVTRINAMASAPAAM